MLTKGTMAATIVAWSASLAVACGGEAVVDVVAAAGGTGAAGASGTGAGGTTGTTGTTGSGGSASSHTCEDLEGLYASALASAKQCDALINAVQCTMLVPDRVVCACDTYVNPANADAVETLEALLNEALDIGCLCSADYECAALQGGGCMSDGGEVDTCVDYGND